MPVYHIDALSFSWLKLVTFTVLHAVKRKEISPEFWNFQSFLKAFKTQRHCSLLPDKQSFSFKSFIFVVVILEGPLKCVHFVIDCNQSLQIHAFSDASKEAIGTAVYLREVDGEGEISVSLLYGRSKIAPVHSTSIPRLELCSAVLATQAVSIIRKELDVEINEEIYYSDSKVVLGYIQNESRRFYVYVADRVQTIRNATDPHQWRYIDTANNAADLVSGQADGVALAVRTRISMERTTSASRCTSEDITRRK